MNQNTDYFTGAELNPNNRPTTAEISSNLDELHGKLNELRTAYGKPMRINSGLRSIDDQKRINPKAMKSKHLLGQAADIADPKGELAAFCKKNIELMKDIGLWFEDPDYTKGWLHCQTCPPASAKRFFMP